MSTPFQHGTGKRIALLHYSAPPTIGGVESVIDAHARLLQDAGHSVAVVAGQGEPTALAKGVHFLSIPTMDSQHPAILAASNLLELGQMPPDFQELTAQLVSNLAPQLAQSDAIIVHNVFTKHFNLPLTAALITLLNSGTIRNCVAWCHDFTWTSPSSRSKVHDGYPWDLLRTCHPGLTYVVVSEQRRQTLASLLRRPLHEIKVIYNGVFAPELLGLSDMGADLVNRLGLLESDLTMLMPVRVTQAKNIEYALRVVSALKAHLDHPKLVLTGPPDPHDENSSTYFQQLQALRKELGVEEEMRFVFESGPEEDVPLLIDAQVVADLLRVSDLMFMPSHREGFGMPILEAGLLGIPVVCTGVPAAAEIGRQDVIRFDHNQEPAEVAQLILDLVVGSPTHRLRRRVRQRYTWQAIYRQDIAPLLA